MTASIATFATVYKTIGLALFAIVFIAVAVYAIVNVVFSGKAELGSEIELAANRKPYYSDEELEGPKLDRALTLGLLTLFVLAVSLPLYWVMEPARQSNAAEEFDRQFVARGADLFAPTGDNLQALNCAGCHGGLDGGVVNYNLTDPATGQVAQVEWKAPALGSVLLRFSREEVTYILTYGRPGTPMPAWGVAGGGPLNDQQIQNLIDYLDANTIDHEQVQERVTAALDTYLDARFEDGSPVFSGPDAEGEALFNMGLLGNPEMAAYGCGRCHTQGWSYADVETSSDDNGTPEDQSDDFLVVNREDYEAATANSGCGGGFAFNLCDGDTERQFPEVEDPEDGESPHQAMIDFVSEGSVVGKQYGRQGQGSGRMPGFGVRPAEPGLFWINGGAERPAGEGMLTQEQIEAIVEYERTLTAADAGEANG
jgi:mono/diheme cytochrome c family protein